MSVRSAMFGAFEPMPVDEVLGRVHGDATARLRESWELIDSAVDKIADNRHVLLSGAEDALQQVSDDLKQDAERLTSGLDRQHRVVLMGRTQAGKSTLFEYLTRGSGSRIGDGRQRYSRDVCERALTDHPNAVLVDTPGVGGMGGERDFEQAIAAADEADLVIWVNANNSTQPETARALEILARSGTPLVVVLNCRWDLADPGMLEVFRRYPEEPFEDSKGHIDRLQEFLDHHAQRPLEVVDTHIGAAWMSVVEDESDSRFLAEASRIGRLHDALEVELGLRAAQRRLVWLADSARFPLFAASTGISARAQQCSDAIPESKRAVRDLDRRLTRNVGEQEIATRSRIRQEIRRKRDWADLNYNLIDSEIDKAWKQALGDVGESLEAVIENGAEDLRDRMARTQGDLADDWSGAGASLPDWDLRTVRGKHAGERDRGKIITAVVLAVPAVAGALIGGFAGAAIGGAVAALAKEPLGGWVRSLSKKRLRALRVEVTNVLDDLDEQACTVWSNYCRSVGTEIGERSKEQLSALDRVGSHARMLDSTAADIAEHAEELDLTVARGFMSLTRGERRSASVLEAHRQPGFLLVVGVDSEGLPEFALDPLDEFIEPVRAYPAPSHCAPVRTAAHAADVGHLNRVLSPAEDGSLTVFAEPQPPAMMKMESHLIGRAADVSVNLVPNHEPNPGAPR